MPLKERDFVLVEYTVRVKDTGEVIETTSEEVAKSSGIYREGDVYGPKLMIIGEGRYVRGFEEAVASSEVGEEKTVEVEPSKAYGDRDPNKVKILSLRELAKLNIVPEPGKAIEIGGAVGIVKSISGGRVVVDFNHPLSGKTLVFTYKIVKRLEDPVEKIKYLMLRRSRRLSAEKLVVRISQDMLKIEIETPEEVILAEDLQIFKRTVAEEIFRYFPEVKQVVFIDSFFRPQ
ncbi:MAG: FKBP-type peptidyl-prolyl cis-trans isomerase [Desulfurococcales archaeon]|jgi:peptidylprolyl isomerase|nr:FKBP-type peptidyl-prolyl cis-trans isomerase [Desulfurococcales archaeon]